MAYIDNDGVMHDDGCFKDMPQRKGPSSIEQAMADRDRQIEELRQENATLRAALGTPEVYAGVVTEECEKHWAEIITGLRAENERLNGLVFLHETFGANPAKVNSDLQARVKELEMLLRNLKVRDAHADECSYVVIGGVRCDCGVPAMIDAALNPRPGKEPA